MARCALIKRGRTIHQCEMPSGGVHRGVCLAEASLAAVSQLPLGFLSAVSRLSLDLVVGSEAVVSVGGVLHAARVEADLTNHCACVELVRCVSCRPVPVTRVEASLIHHSVR